MIDIEVERLRRLRGSALRLRAVARALEHRKGTAGDVLLSRGRCAAWRVARTVSGRLRAHPNERYQRDAGVGTLLKNSMIATAASLGASSHRRVMTVYSRQLKALMRELDDARALTWAAELSDTFGRSQQELRSLSAALLCEASEPRTTAASRQPLHAVDPVAAGSSFLTI